MLTRTAVLLAATLLTGSPALAQMVPATPMDGMMAEQMNQFNAFGRSLDAGMAYQMDQYDALGQQLSDVERQATASAMADPQIQQAYAQYQMSGGTQAYPEWALNYVATNGYSAPGIAAMNAQNARNAAAEAQALAGLRQAEGAYGAAVQGMNAQQAENMGIAGYNLQGQGLYDVPTGGQVPLSYMPSAGPVYDPSNGYTYMPGVNGAYMGVSPEGYGYDMPQAQ